MTLGSQQRDLPEGGAKGTSYPVPVGYGAGRMKVFVLRFF